MAAGTPVVASDLPGYRNVAVNGDEAFLVHSWGSGNVGKGINQSAYRSGVGRKGLLKPEPNE